MEGNEINADNGQTSMGADAPNNSLHSNTSWINNDGSFGDYKIAPEGVKEVLEKKQFKTIADMAKSYQELEKMTGNSIRIPEDGDPKKLAEIYNKLGRPAEAKGYEYTPPENSPIEIDSNLLDSFKEYGYNLGLNNKQFKEVVDFQVNAMSSMLEAERQASEAKLQEVWGKDKETKIKSIVDFANSVGLGEAIEKAGVGHNADILIALNELKGKLSEDTIKSGSNIKPNKQDRIKEIMANPAFMDRLNPDHNALHKEWVELATGQA